jgi:hypothetical protein
MDVNDHGSRGAQHGDTHALSRVRLFYGDTDLLASRERNHGVMFPPNRCGD